MMASPGFGAGVLHTPHHRLNERSGRSVAVSRSADKIPKSRIAREGQRKAIKESRGTGNLDGRLMADGEVPSCCL